MTLRELFHLLLQGGPGFCQIAVTNACNAHCRFCSFPQVAAKDRVGADPERLFRGLHALKQAGVRYLSITGGEPPGLPGLPSHIREMLPLLKQAGLDPVASVTLSRMLGDLRAMMDFLKDLGFRRVTFSYPLNRLASSS